MHEAAEITGHGQSTLRQLHKKGVLVPYKISPGGTRYYSDEQLKEYIGEVSLKPRITVAYARVSSKKQAGDLDRQVENLKLYLCSKGRGFEVITDIGSSIDYQKRGLLELTRRIENDEIERVVILHKDRLLRFGFELFEEICRIHNCEIEIVDHTPKPDEEELITDLVQIVTGFGCKLQGKRRKKARELLKEVRDVSREDG